ncbi:hypothetical protein Gogos_020331 [Gossypium gossypioides]|uniref:Uncharacterized protein n=1 Tax=Gossypium gossypioides TaxID=34282 RepID=A0A7J9CZA2_GOSGO|nr:hypothetical protein [Gossypium gossypioides]
MRSYIGVVTSIGFHCLEFGELLDMDYGYRKKIQEISSAWKQTRRMKRLAVGPMTTPEYNEW